MEEQRTTHQNTFTAKAGTSSANPAKSNTATSRIELF
jgi:hypothetical protein